MKPKTRLLIQFTLPNGDKKGWGYDYPLYENIDYLRKCIENDFSVNMPENSEIHLFYYLSNDVIAATTAAELAQKSVDWIIATGEYNGQ